MATPEPKPTLLASMGVSGGVPPATTPPSQKPEPAPPPAPRRRNPVPARGPGPPVRTQDSTPDPEQLSAALGEIRQRHRERRAVAERTPLAPLNVDIPLELLEHVRHVSQDIPYPLRRLAEEAIELWLLATSNGAPQRSATSTGQHPLLDDEHEPEGRQDRRV